MWLSLIIDSDFVGTTTKGNQATTIGVEGIFPYGTGCEMQEILHLTLSSHIFHIYHHKIGQLGTKRSIEGELTRIPKENCDYHIS